MHQSYFRNGMVKRFLGILKQSAPKSLRSFFMQVPIVVGCIFILSFVSIIHIYTTPYNFIEKEIPIKKGARTWDILSSLHNDGLLPHPLVILIGAMFLEGSVKIVAGEYLFNTETSPQDILHMLQKGQVIEHRLTFPEGWSVHQMITHIQDDDRLSGTIPNSVLEGSLFPSTYNIQRGQDRTQLLKKMADKMDKVLGNLMKLNRNPFIKTPYDLVTFASILEKEAATPAELPRISGVFINRLKKKMRLQSCPTVIYAKTSGKQKFSTILTYDDLKIDSDYNTYLKDGLPIGPICCPGLNALKAAVNPSDTDELFFIFDGKQHHFSVTYKEHLKRKRHIKNAVRISDE